MAMCSFTASFFPEKNESILKDGFEFYGVRKDVSLLPFVYNGKVGFTNKSGALEIIVTPKFDDIILSSSTLIPVQKNGKWGVVDITKTSSDCLVVDCIYNEIHPCDNNSVYINGYKNKLIINR